ncbi:MAG: RHS repeat-associated core domain-containing protein [Ktedonobacteraceae bacterium]
MTCRNIDSGSSHTCGATPTGAQMTYDSEGRLASWTVPSGTTSSINYLYDNEGNRVLQHQSTTTGSTTTTTDTVTFDSYTETVITGGTTLTTQFYTVGGQRVAMKQGNALYYLLGDLLGSVSIVLKDDGTFQAAQLFAPYGTTRYTQGTMPTTYNFTGQRLDSQTGLLYYNSRYYDPMVGRFVRADTVQDNGQGMDPYAYAGGDPETLNDPTGQYYSTSVSLSQPGGAIGYINYAAGTITTIKNYPGVGGEIRGLNGDKTLTGTGLHQDTFTFAMERKYGGYNPDKVKNPFDKGNGGDLSLLGGALALNPVEEGACIASDICLAIVIVVAVVLSIQAPNAIPATHSAFSDNDVIGGTKHNPERTFTQHGADMANDRHFTEAEILRIIATGERTLDNAHNTGVGTGQQWKYRDANGNTVLLSGDKDRIVTVYRPGQKP